MSRKRYEEDDPELFHLVRMCRGLRYNEAVRTVFSLKNIKISEKKFRRIKTRIAELDDKFKDVVPMTNRVFAVNAIDTLTPLLKYFVDYFKDNKDFCKKKAASEPISKIINELAKYHDAISFLELNSKRESFIE